MTDTFSENTSENTSGSTDAGSDSPTLVVVSKVKKIVKERGGLNTSSCCIEALTTLITNECLKGIERAKSSGRKTLMGRDITSDAA